MSLRGAVRAVGVACSGLLLLGLAPAGPAAAAPAPAPASAVQRADGGLRTWWYDAMKLPAAHRQTTGAGVRIAVIDEAIDPTAPELRGAHVTLAQDCNGDRVKKATGAKADHGTAVTTLISGTGRGADGAPGIRGIAPGADVRFYATDSEPSDAKVDCTTDVFTARLMEMAIADHPDIITTSLGLGYSYPMRDALQKALDQNIVVIGATGDRTRPSYVHLPMEFPAARQGVVAVNAAARTGRAWVNNPPPDLHTFVKAYPTITAPGVDVTGVGYLPGRGWVSGVDRDRHLGRRAAGGRRPGPGQVEVPGRDRQPADPEPGALAVEQEELLGPLLRLRPDLGHEHARPRPDEVAGRQPAAARAEAGPEGLPAQRVRRPAGGEQLHECRGGPVGRAVDRDRGHADHCGRRLDRRGRPAGLGLAAARGGGGGRRRRRHRTEQTGESAGHGRPQRRGSLTMAGPNEAKLDKAASAQPVVLMQAADTWTKAADGLGEVAARLETARSAIAASWTGDDAEAATAAFSALSANVTTNQERMATAGRSVDAAAASLMEAQKDLNTLPPAGVAPDPLAPAAQDDPKAVVAHNRETDAAAAGGPSA